MEKLLKEIIEGKKAYDIEQKKRYSEQAYRGKGTKQYIIKRTTTRTKKGVEIMNLEEAKKVLMGLPEYQDLVSKECEAIDTVIHELVALQNLLDEKNEELDRLQKENDLAKKALIANSYEADERNNLLAEVQRLKKENEKLKEIDLTTVHIKGVCDEKEKWRNKIREKIEKIKNKPNNPNQKVIATQIDTSLIACLQDLLREE